jgi:hypothetical protein
MKMNDQPGNIVTQFFAWLATLPLVLGWRLRMSFIWRSV